MKVDKSKWEKKSLDTVCKIINGDRGKNYPAKSKLSSEGEYPFISALNLRDYSVSIDNLLYLSEDQYNALSNGKIVKGDIALCIRGSLGKFGYFPFDNGAIASSLVIVRSKNNVKQKFLGYYFRSNDFKIQLSENDNGVAQPNIGANKIEKFIINLPSLREQDLIISELDAIQTMIDGYKAQLDDLDELAKSIFLDMFGDPVANPKGWELDIFSNLFSLKSGEGLSATQFTNGDFPVYGGNGITGFHNQYNKKGESIIIGRVGAKCGNVRLVKGLFWLTDNAFELFQKKTLFDNIFLSKLLSLLNLGSKVKAMAQPVISNIALKNVPVILPPLDLQQQFAAKIEAIETQKEKYKAQLADAEQLMAERMQYYFS